MKAKRRRGLSPDRPVLRLRMDNQGYTEYDCTIYHNRIVILVMSGHLLGEEWPPMDEKRKVP